jgi:lysophospholipase L1-like esterase
MSTNKLRVVCAASLALNALMVVGLAAAVARGGGWSELAGQLSHLRGRPAAVDADQAVFLERESIFEHLPPVAHGIVFLGDSHIGQYEWGEMFPGAVNRGIGGDTTVGVLKRLPGIVRTNPRAIFLAIGHNDRGNLGFNGQQSLEKIREIVAIIRRDSPQTVIYLQSLVPCRKSQKNLPRQEISAGMKRMADGDVHGDAHGDVNGDKVRYVDFSGALFKDGLLDAKYTFDGEHLNSDGYAIWTRALLASAPELAH